MVMIVLVGSCLAQAQETGTARSRSPDVEKIVATVRTDCQAMDHLDVLCNRIGPRLTGSDNLTLNWETPAEQPKSKP